MLEIVTALALLAAASFVVVQIKRLPFLAIVHVVEGIEQPRLYYIGRYARLAAIGSRYRAGVDPSITPHQAGAAAHAIYFWRADSVSLQFLKPGRPESLNEFAVRIATINPMNSDPEHWQLELLPLAAKGLTSAQRNYLESIARTVDDTLFDALAHAARADIVGTRYALDGRLAAGQASALPKPYPSPFGYAAARRFARAALLFSERRFGAADSALREVTSVGLLLWNDGAEDIDNIVGGNLVRRSLDARIVLDSLLGRTAEARALRNELEVAARMIRSDSTEFGFGTWSAESAALRIVSDTLVPDGARWTLLRGRSVSESMRFCSGLLDRASWIERENKFRPHFSRSESDRQLFSWMADPPDPRTCPRRDSTS